MKKVITESERIMSGILKYAGGRGHVEELFNHDTCEKAFFEGWCVPPPTKKDKYEFTLGRWLHNMRIIKHCMDYRLLTEPELICAIDQTHKDSNVPLPLIEEKERERYNEIKNNRNNKRSKK